MRTPRALPAAAAVGLIVTVLLAGSAGAAARRTTLYLHATSPASAHVDELGARVGASPRPWMDATAPTSPTPRSASLGIADPNTRDNVLLPAFVAQVHGTVSDPVGRFTVATAASSLVVMLFRDADPYPVVTRVVPVPSETPAVVSASFSGESFYVERELVLEVTTRTPPVSGPRGTVGPARVSRTSEGVLLFDSATSPSSLSITTAPGRAPAAPAPKQGDFRSYPEPLVPSGPLEASIAVNRRTGSVFLFASQDVLRLRFHKGEPQWKDVTFGPANAVASDPILWSDPTTGRLFTLQLLGPTSSMAYSDDDGQTWQAAGPPMTAPSIDHETLGGGPFHSPVPGPSSYPNALYYCAQGVIVAQCARSDDGGTTWGPPVPVVTNDECGTLHGHVVVDQHGDVYLPFRNCGGAQAVAVSRDNGLTWSLRHVPATTAAPNDPMVSVDKAGTLYLGTNSGGRALFSVSTDHGETWSPAVDVGAVAGIKRARYPMVVAGDARRAAFAFYGTAQDGDDEAPGFRGTWHLYVALTYDAGRTWSVVNATPGNPVQRGPICTTGAGCTVGVNLFDYQDIALDADGRVLLGFSDGCLDQCDGPDGVHEEDDYLGVVARQVAGEPLLS